MNWCSLNSSTCILFLFLPTMYIFLHIHNSSSVCSSVATLEGLYFKKNFSWLALFQYLSILQAERLLKFLDRKERVFEYELVLLYNVLIVIKRKFKINIMTEHFEKKYNCIVHCLILICSEQKLHSFIMFIVNYIINFRRNR